jgi:hypothetical protein
MQNNEGLFKPFSCESYEMSSGGYIKSKKKHHPLVGSCMLRSYYKLLMRALLIIRLILEKTLRVLNQQQ